MFFFIFKVFMERVDGFYNVSLSYYFKVSKMMCFLIYFILRSYLMREIIFILMRF